MENDSEYTDYPLEYRGDPFFGIEYFITVKSNNKKLKFNIDSGAEINLVREEALSGCCYEDIGADMPFRSVQNETNASLIFFEFILEDVDFNTVDHNDLHKLIFSVMPKEQVSIFDDSDYDGLLGSTFLQYCDVNFREGYIRVYKDQLGGKVTGSLLEGLNAKKKAYDENTQEAH